MSRFESQYKVSSRSWQALMGGAALTFLVFFAIASTRIGSVLAPPAQGEAYEIYYKPPPAPPAIKQAPLPKSSRSERSFSFDFALREDPVEITLDALEFDIEHDLGASASLQLELDKRFEASRPQIADLSEFMIFENTDVDERPRAIRSVDPVIPPKYRGERVEVTMFYFVSAKGRPERISVLSSTSQDPVYAEAARKALAKWRFRPARNNGKPVNCWVQQTIRYVKGSDSPFSI